MIARLLYLVLVIFAVRLLFRSIVERLSMEMRANGNERERNGSARGTPAVYKGLMVRDPQCGVYLPENRSISEVRAGERVHFCSEACRNAYHRAEELHEVRTHP